MRIPTLLLVLHSVLGATLAEAKEGDWNPFGLTANMPVGEALSIMLTKCDGNVSHKKHPAEKIDAHSCNLTDRSSLEIWSICGQLVKVSVRKTVLDAAEAQRVLFADCLPSTSLQGLGERRISLGCTQGGYVSIEFPQVGERISVVKHQSGDLGGALRSCPK